MTPRRMTLEKGGQSTWTKNRSSGAALLALIGSILSSFFLSDERAGDAPQSGAASEGHRKL